MATQTLTNIPITNKTAQWAVEADGIFCVASGLIFLIDAEGVSRFMGVQTPVVIGVLGIGVFMYGVGLLYDVFKRLVNARLLKALMGLDAIWIVSSLVLLIGAPTALNTEGRWVVLILADVVAAFAVWKFGALRRMAREA